MTIPPRFLRGLTAATMTTVVLLGVGCRSLSTTGATTATKTDATAASSPDAVLVKAPTDLSFLLSMSFTEAKSISTQQLEFPPHLKIAADSIEVFKYSDDGKPRKARARGKVFVEMNFGEPAKALCQEAFITEDEIILRGSPILQRGGSMVEGLDDSTIFYMFGSSLRVIGLHKVNNQSEMASLLPALGNWAQGPNLLLPPLTENAVPTSIRDSMQQAAEAEMLHQRLPASCHSRKAGSGQTQGRPSSHACREDQKSAHGGNPQSHSAEEILLEPLPHGQDAGLIRIGSL
jgi:hypothetical protein